MQGVAVTAGSARRRRTLALVVSLLVALVPLLIGGASPAASQGVECTLNPDAPECQSTDGDEDPPSSPSETTLAEEPATTATTESTQVTDQPDVEDEGGPEVVDDAQDRKSGRAEQRGSVRGVLGGSRQLE